MLGILQPSLRSSPYRSENADLEYVLLKDPNRWAYTAWIRPAGSLESHALDLDKWLILAVSPTPQNGSRLAQIRGV